MFINRVKLFNEVTELREKTFKGDPLTEILIRTGTVAKLLGDQEVVRWVEFETKLIEGFFYKLKERTRHEIMRFATYRFAKVKYSFPSFPELGKEEQLRIAVILSYIQKQSRDYFCSTPIGVLEDNLKSGVEVGVPSEEKKRILKAFSYKPPKPIDKTISTLVFSSACLFIPPESIRGLLDVVRGILVRYFDKITQNQPLNIIDVFYKSMDHVHDDIKKLYPDIAGEFEAIHLNIMQDKSENFSNVASACRRVLKKFADAEYPSRTETTPDGHSLTDDKSKNRIIEWIKDKTKGAGEAGLLSVHADLLAKYLDSLYSLASKGDKNPITRNEAELCSIHTYLIIAELVRIKLSSMSPVSGTT